MHMLVMGINYRSATVELREPFSVDAKGLQHALAKLRSLPSVLEAVLVSTCNRTEVYAVCDDVSAARGEVESFYADLSGLASYSFQNTLYTYRDAEAVSHLMRVVTGLDSMVIGETQILGQVRTAFLGAQSEGMTGLIFNHLFQTAVAFGKRVQTETGIGQSAVSVSYAAAMLAKKVFTSLSDKTALIIGAGKMAELTLTHLRAQGIGHVLVMNRTRSRADELADQHGGEAVAFEKLCAAVARADIIVSSTGARGYVLTPEMAGPALRRRKSRPLFCIDIAVPRDIDPAMARLDGVYVYDIDDLQDVVSVSVSLRRQEAERVQSMIASEVSAFYGWMAQRDCVPLIAQVRQRAGDIQESVYDSLIHKLPELDERQRKVVQKHLASVVNQLLRDPIANLKDSAIRSDAPDLTEPFARIFGLGPAQNEDLDGGYAQGLASVPEEGSRKTPVRDLTAVLPTRQEAVVLPPMRRERSTTACSLT